VSRATADLPAIEPVFWQVVEDGLAALSIALTPGVRAAIEDHVRLLSAWNEAINLTAQSAVQNGPVKGTDNWWRLEDSWRALRASGIQVHASIDVRYPDAVSRRPEARTEVDRHDGRRSPRRVFKETPAKPKRER